jgi:hypothetical protein
MKKQTGGIGAGFRRELFRRFAALKYFFKEKDMTTNKWIMFFKF